MHSLNQVFDHLALGFPVQRFFSIDEKLEAEAAQLLRDNDVDYTRSCSRVYLDNTNYVDRNVSFNYFNHGTRNGFVICFCRAEQFQPDQSLLRTSDDLDDVPGAFYAFQAKQRI